MDGSTDTLCKKVAEALSDSGFDVSFVYPHSLNIGHCVNCNKCKDLKRCAFFDGMDEIYEKINSSSILVLGTPVHFSGISSVLKQVIDRFQLYWYHTPSKKRVVGLVANGGNKNPYFNNIISESTSVSNTLNGKWSGALTVRETDLGGLNDLVFQDAYRFGESLASSALRLLKLS